MLGKESTGCTQIKHYLKRALLPIIVSIKGDLTVYV